MSGLRSDQDATRVVKPATVEESGESGAIADTYGGRVHVEWDPTAAVTPLGVLGGCRRYAHLTALRRDAVNPPLLGTTKMVSENAVRRGLGSIAAASGEKWMGGAPVALRSAAAGRAVGAGRGYDGGAAVRASGGRGGRLQSGQAGVVRRTACTRT